MKCSHCGSDNHPDALTCARCMNILVADNADTEKTQKLQMPMANTAAMGRTIPMRNPGVDVPTQPLQRPQLLVQKSVASSTPSAPASKLVTTSNAQTAIVNRPQTIEPHDSQEATLVNSPVPLMPEPAAPKVLSQTQKHTRPPLSQASSDPVKPVVPRHSQAQQMSASHAANKVVPSQPMLPDNAPRATDEGLHVAVRFDRTFIGQPASSPPGLTNSSTRTRPEPVELSPARPRTLVADTIRENFDLNELLGNVSSVVTAEMPLPAASPKQKKNAEALPEPPLFSSMPVHFADDIFAPEDINAVMTGPGFEAGNVITRPDQDVERVESDGENVATASHIHRIVSLAPTWRRLTAGMIDLIIVAAMTSVYLVFAIMQLPADIGPAHGTGFDLVIDAALVYAQATVPAAYVFVATLAVYEFLFLLIFAATPGLFVVGARVVPLKRKRLGFFGALLRAIVSVLGLLCLGLGWSALWLSRRRRTVHDFFAGTIVGRFTDEVQNAPLVAAEFSKKSA